MNYKLYTLNSFGDERGALVPIENGNNSDFDIKRVFYIYGASSDNVRGMHANKYSKFILISVCGRCKILIDDGNETTVIELNKPNQALYLDKMIWKEMYDFSDDAVLLVLSNEKYNEKEYIRDYKEFKKNVKENQYE